MPQHILLSRGTELSRHHPMNDGSE